MTRKQTWANPGTWTSSETSFDHETVIALERPVGGGQREGGRGHVVARELVADVHHRGLGAAGEDRALDRAHVVVPAPEIGEEGDDGTRERARGGTRGGPAPRGGRTRAGSARHGCGIVIQTARSWPRPSPGR